MRSVLLTLAWAGISAVPLSAQSGARNPGAPGGDGRGADSFLAEYYAEVLQRTDELTTRWRRAWREDDLRDLMDLYLDDVQLLFSDQGAFAGKAAVQGFFERELDALGEIQFSLLDFDASGRMAYMSGPFQLDRQRADGVRERVTGRYVFVLLNRQRTWRIRSQYFIVEGEPQVLPSGQDGGSRP